MEEQTISQAKIGKLPGTIREVEIKEGCTVKEVIARADLDSKGFEVRLNGEPTNPGDKVKHGDTVLLVKKIQGNNEVVFVLECVCR